MVDLIRAADFQCRCLLAALEAGEPSRVARSLGIQVCFLSTVGHRTSAQAARLIDVGLELAERTGDPYARAYSLTAQSIHAYQLGRWRLAVERCLEALPVFQQRCINVAWEVDTIQLHLLWSLWHSGELRELGRQFAACTRQADERNNVYLGATARLSFPNVVWIADDDPVRARRELKDAVARWAEQKSQLGRYRGYQVQNVLALLTEGQIDLYEGDGAAVIGRIEQNGPELRGSMSLRTERTRINLAELRARGHLVLAARERSARTLQLRLARAQVHRLRQERAPWGWAQADLIEAAAAALAGDPAAPDRFEAAARACEAVDMPLQAVAARRRRGQLLGGEEGQSLIAAADELMRARGIRSPERFAELLAPGGARPLGG
jgi:hypothetical protein